MKKGVKSISEIKNGKEGFEPTVKIIGDENGVERGIKEALAQDGGLLRKRRKGMGVRGGVWSLGQEGREGFVTGEVGREK